METGKLYFIKDEFYERFPDCGLSRNKETISGKEHNRPCCYALKYDNNDTHIYWMIPVSSKVQKYRLEYEKAIKKYGICDNISFGYILGKNAHFCHKIYFQ